MIQFEPVITLGVIIQTVSFIALVLTMYYKVVERIRVLETKLDPIWDHFLRETNELRLGRK